MDGANIRVTNSPRMSAPSFALRPVAEALAKSEKDRILRGYNLKDQPSRPLTLAYARQKVKRGALAIRNWASTFSLMSTFGIQSESSKSATIGWPADQQKKVGWNEKWDQMAGLSENDKRAGDEAADRVWGEISERVWDSRSSKK